MLKSSRQITIPSGYHFPFILKGFARAFGYGKHWQPRSKWHLPLVGPSPVLAYPQANSVIHGILFEIQERDLPKLDQRESGYRRLEITGQQIQDYNKDNTKSWIYIVDNLQDPTRLRPIIQSYVDVILAGALSHSIQMAEDFICTTQGWDNEPGCWLDDRKNPLYPRALTQINKESYDALLKKNIPHAIHKRIEFKP